MKTASLTIKRMALRDLRPHPRNPRTHPLKGSPEWDVLRKSLESDYFDPIVWNKRNGLLVSGHLRTKVLLDAGFTHADVSVVEYDESTHIARMIAANKLQGDDDLPALKDLLLELDTGAFDMSLCGYDEAEIEKMMTAIPPEEEYEKDTDGEARPRQVKCPHCGEEFEA